MKAKGGIVEGIAAWLHGWPGVTVERNVPLPAQSDPTRKREIDILLTAQVAGYPVRFALECKNEATPIGSPRIDAFAGKLQDVGIPRQQGIFISASGYTKGAIRRAEQAGIRALHLRGLSVDGLKASISIAAHQSIVFFLVVVEQVTLFTDLDTSLPLFVDADGRLCGTVPHLIAASWQKGGISTKPGHHDIVLPVPDSWRVRNAAGGQDKLLKGEVYVKLRVQALTMTVTGQANEYSLVRASSSEIEKLGIKVFFQAEETAYPLTIFDDTQSLDAFLRSRQGFRITQRIKVPRIHYQSAYWPLSRRAAEQIRAVARNPRFVDGELVFPPTQAVEGLDIAAAWESPMSIGELEEFFLAGHASPGSSQPSTT